MVLDVINNKLFKHFSKNKQEVIVEKKYIIFIIYKVIIYIIWVPKILIIFLLFKN